MAYDSWYCGIPGWSSLIDSCVPTANDQVSIMKSNFGPSADPVLVQQALDQYRKEDLVNYDETVANLQCKDSIFCDPLGKLGLTGSNIPWGTLLIVGVGMFAMVTIIGGGSPRRYGR